MQDAELNRKLAEALGWVIADHEMFGDVPMWLNLSTGYAVGSVEEFSPATDSNHLREFVLPEVERRGLEEDFGRLLADHMIATKPPLSWPKQYMHMLTMEPRVLAEAALKVLEASA